MKRRDVLRGALALGSLAVSGTVLSIANASDKMERFEQTGGDFSWKPNKLDPDEVANLAYKAYHHKGFG